MSARRMTMRELAQAAKQIAEYIEWDGGMINDFHKYAQHFKCTLGGNVYEFVLRDALRSRGMTLEQFRELRSEAQEGKKA